MGAADNKRLLLFPVEIINRELDYRIFLAAMCAAKGSRVILGQHDVIRKLLPQLRSGVYVGKNIFPTLFNTPDADQHYRTLKYQDFGLVHLHEEGAVFLGRQEEEWRDALLLRLDPRVLSVDDEVCVWGSFQERAYRALDPPAVARVTATGHPRFDLLREPYRWFYRDEIDRLHARYGDDFLLFNSTFTSAQSKLGPEYVFSPGRGYVSGDETSRNLFLTTWSYQQRTLTRIIELLERLRREEPERTIVIRPHPAEDPRSYAAMFRGIANVVVVHEGSAVPWLLAARAVLHCGCTTAIEATLAGKNVIFFRPEEQLIAEPALAAAFGTRCATADEVLTALASPAPAAERENAWSHELIANLSGDLDSFGAVCDVISRAQERRAGGSAAPSAGRIRAGQAARMANEAGRGVARRLSPPRAQLASARRTYFPRLDRGSLRRKLDLVSSRIGTATSATFLGDMLVVLEREC